MRKKFKTLSGIGLATFLLAGCTDAEYFMGIQKIEHAKVLEVGTETVAKQTYTEIEFTYNGEEFEQRFNGDDYGFRDYYDSAKLFDKEVYLDIVLDEGGYILVATLSEEDTDGK